MACCYALHAAVMFGAWVKGEVDSVIDEMRICSRRTVSRSWGVSVPVSLSHFTVAVGMSLHWVV